MYGTTITDAFFFVCLLTETTKLTVDISEDDPGLWCNMHSSKQEIYYRTDASMIVSCHSLPMLTVFAVQSCITLKTSGESIDLSTLKHHAVHAMVLNSCLDNIAMLFSPICYQRT